MLSSAAQLHLTMSSQAFLNEQLSSLLDNKTLKQSDSVSPIIVLSVNNVGKLERSLCMLI